MSTNARDGEVLWHVTVLSNFSRGYDKYSQCYSKKAIPESTYPDRFYLLRENEIEIGVQKARGLLDRLALPGNRLLAMRTVVPVEALNENRQTGLGRYIEQSNIRVDEVAWIAENASDGERTSTTVEEAMALSLRLVTPELRSYQELRPRTFSILPIARGCQARCPFCFSEASVSAQQDQGRLDMRRVGQFAQIARSRGAERFVITGGGEPGLVPHARLLDFVAVGRKVLGKTVLITNGYHLARQNAEVRSTLLSDYHDSGLRILAVSHHHHESSKNAQMMGLAIDVEAIAQSWRQDQDRWLNLKLRFTCVLQKGGIDSLHAVEKYVDWASAMGVEELCFKELYVSTSVESVYHRHAANDWSRLYQVPLSIVLDFAACHGLTEESRLPWGSPVFRGVWRGRPLSIAAYTEPSLFWERTQGIARSWNLMADGRCLVSLEDRASELQLEDAA